MHSLFKLGRQQPGAAKTVASGTFSRNPEKTREIDVPKIKNKVSAISAICRCSVNNAEKKKNRANKVGFHAIY